MFHYGDEGDFSGHRSFQVDLFIKNLSAKPITPWFGVSRWIITDGANEREDTKTWEWGQYQKPVIGPSGSAGWTVLAYPLLEGEWVKAAEYKWNRVTYRREFDLGEFGDAHNYVACH